MGYPDKIENLEEGVKGTDAMSAHAELHNDTNKVVNKIQSFLGEKGDDKDSGTISGDVNELKEVVDDLVINGGDSLPDVSGQQDKALMVRGTEAEWSQVTPDDVKYSDTTTFVLPGDYDVTGKSQNDVNVALQDGILTVDAEVEKKYDKGDDAAISDAKRDYADAAAMESAVKGNTTEIGKLQDNWTNLLESLQGFDGSQLQVELEAYFEKYSDDDDESVALIYDSAAKMGVVVQRNEQAVIDNASAIVSGDAATLAAAKTYAEEQDAITLEAAATAAEAADVQVLADAETYADTGDQTTYTNSMAYTDAEILKITHPDQDLKFDRGVGNLEYNDAVTMGKAVKENKDAIGSLVGYDDKPLTERVTDNEKDIAVIKSEQTTQNTNISANATKIDTKFDDGGTSYKDAKAIEDAIANIEDNVYDDAELRGLISAEEAARIAGDSALESSVTQNTGDIAGLKTEQGTQDAAIQANADAIAGLKAYDDTALAGRVTVNEGDITDIKAEQLTQNTDIAKNTADIAAIVVPDVSEFTTKTYVDSQDLTKFDKGATTYGDAKAMEDAIATNATNISNNATDISNNATNISNNAAAILQEQADREAGDSANSSSITENTTAIDALSNRLDALENTSLSSEWEIVVNSTANPETGKIVLNTADWLSTTLIAISHTDKNGTTHDFSNIKVGDTIQIGVGPNAKAAGSSAAYEITGLDNTAGKFDVKHLVSTGTPTPGFIAVVAVYPAFDPSNYATQAELQAVDAKADSKVAMLPNGTDNAQTTGVMALTQAQYDALTSKDPYTIYLISDYVDTLPEQLKEKFDVGAGTTTLNDATLMEAAIDANTGDIAENTTNIETNSNNIEANKTDIDSLVVNIGGSVDVDGNITLPNGGAPIDISEKLDKGTGLVASDAKELEDAIGENASNISLLVSGLGGDINNIEVDALPDQSGQDGKFLTTDGKDASWSDVDSLPDQTDKEGKFLTTDGDKALWAELEIVPHAHNYDGSIHDGDGGEFVPHNHAGLYVEVEKLNTAAVKLNDPVEVGTRKITIDTQEQANEYFADELDSKLTKGMTWGQLAGRG